MRPDWFSNVRGRRPRLQGQNHVRGHFKLEAGRGEAGFVPLLRPDWFSNVQGQNHVRGRRPRLQGQNHFRGHFKLEAGRGEAGFVIGLVMSIPDPIAHMIRVGREGWAGRQRCIQITSWENGNSDKRKEKTTRLKNTPKQISKRQDTASQLTYTSRIAESLRIIQISPTSSFPT